VRSGRRFAPLGATAEPRSRRSFLFAAAGLLALSACAAADEEPAPVVGRRAPEFRLATVAGEPLALAELQGKPVVLNFMATWCGPCKYELPAFQELAGRRPELSVLLVDLGEDSEMVAEFLDSLKVSLPTVLDESGQVTKTYRVRGLPSTFFIDRGGVIRAVQLGALDQRALENGVGKIT
jgi:cytochrome c biogenesis protein CcmG/thiol:disulfide interchange protein DsbE